MARFSVFVLGAALAGIWTLHSLDVGLFRGPSDIVRRWRVAQYILRGINPCDVGFRVLKQEVGPVEEVPLAHRRLFHIPRPANGGEELGVIAEFGPPEATYPPSAQAIIAPTFGLLPQEWVLPAFAILNIGCLALLTTVLASEFRTFGTPLRSFAGLGILVMLFGPTQQTIVSSQHTCLVLLILLSAVAFSGRHSVLSGILFAAAMLKPSVSLPFLVIPLVRGHWRTLLVFASLQFAATLAIAMRVDEDPLTLLSQWIAVSRYFTQGPYSIQSVLNRFGLDNTALGTGIILSFASAIAAWCWAWRKASDQRLFDFLTLGSVLWTYHGPYDLLILLVPIVRMAGPENRSVAPAVLSDRSLAAGAFLAVALGTFNPTYVGPGMLAQGTRWACRGVLVLLFVKLAWGIRSEARRERNATVTSTHRAEALPSACLETHLCPKTSRS